MTCYLNRIKRIVEAWCSWMFTVTNRCLLFANWSREKGKPGVGESLSFGAFTYASSICFSSLVQIIMIFRLATSADCQSVPVSGVIVPFVRVFSSKGSDVEEKSPRDG